MTSGGIMGSAMTVGGAESGDCATNGGTAKPGSATTSEAMYRGTAPGSR